ncbi:single-stranded DNA-binding protein [Sinorhizobium meliloti]|uniref:single-stranded DNA-binding protein n=1 Tax=Rhizobium meliloti TaxID=382 RepID=UPI002073E695|nr:single-stranded DNA-binding protein [Sinorhizobium meliloti]MCM5689744.1 single-stranded DNA-binding protein [Sinorhizobium meliloti]
MRTVNRHTLLGHVGNIIKLKNVLKVNIATNREWQADGERKTATDWAQVTILDKKQAEWIEENVGPGDLVYVESRISNSSYERDGEQVYTTDVIAQPLQSPLEETILTTGHWPPPIPVGRALCEARSQPAAVSAEPGNDRLSSR